METGRGLNRGLEPKPLWLVALVTTLLIGAALLIRFGLWRDHFVPIGYAVPLLVFLWLQDRRFLWIAAVLFGLMTWFKLFIVLHRPSDIAYTALFVQSADLLLVAAGIHYTIGIRRGLVNRNQSLASANEELAKREEEIARQNEELQSQTEELERQSEELRFANDELAAREKTLEHLLALSRSLAATSERGEVMGAVCDTLGYLMSGRAPAAAILEKRRDKMVVVCHHGFGPAGLVHDSLPASESFAPLVLSRMQTAYLEDLDLRPDLKVPQPKEGEPMRSVLATPLKVRGRALGTLEVYSTDKRSWDAQHVSLLESLAAQTAVSLEAGELFDEIQGERNRLRTVLETVSFGIMIANADCSEVKLNRAAATMLGVPVDLAAVPLLSMRGGWTLFENGAPLTRQRHPLVCASNGEEIEGQELELVFNAGRRIRLLVSAGPILDEAGKVLGAVSAWVDITSQKELQSELDKRRREAEEASVRKTRFLAAVSHDIRTPANAINLLAELIRRTSSSPAMAKEIPGLAEELQNSAASLVNLVSDVLDLARFDTGRIELNESEFALDDAVANEVRQLLPMAQAKELQLELEQPQNAILVRADRIKLARVVANLIGNAIKFTHTGHVRVQLTLGSDRRANIHVSDTGMGIEPENMERIFDEFFQLRNPERDASKGTGLGLTICKRLVDAMGGELYVESTPGKGSTFTVALPASSVLAQTRSAAAPPHISGVTPGDEAESPLAGVRVLVVDDHDATRQSIGALLAGEGATVAQARNGGEALQLLREFDPQVLLLDMMLPDMNGADVLKTLDGRRPAGLKKVMILTGDTTGLDVAGAREIGADELIHKPVDVRGLVNKVRVSVGKNGND